MDKEDVAPAIIITLGVLALVGIIVAVVFAMANMSTEHCTSIYTHAACTIGLNR